MDRFLTSPFTHRSSAGWLAWQQCQHSQLKGQAVLLRTGMCHCYAASCSCSASGAWMHCCSSTSSHLVNTLLSCITQQHQSCLLLRVYCSPSLESAVGVASNLFPDACMPSPAAPGEPLGSQLLADYDPSCSLWGAPGRPCPVLDDSQLPFTRGLLTFGVGMSVKMTVTRLQQVRVRPAACSMVSWLLWGC
jgi:hypothetical protein